MGDRGNVQIKEGPSDSGVFFYTHWSGSELPRIVASALSRGKPRWGDTPYLARIIFCEMVAGDVDGETGYGISTAECDPNHPLIVVDDRQQTVTIEDDTLSYKAFIERNL